MREQLQVETSPFGSPQHLADLEQLSAAGHHLPHHYRWTDASDAVWCRVLSSEGIRTGLAVLVGRSQTIPGSRILRIERFGRALHEPLLPQLGEIFDAVVRSVGRVLRLHVEVFEEDAERSERFASALTASGLTELADIRGYRETLRVRLDSDPAVVFSKFSQSTRRDIRAIEKIGLEVREFADLAHLEKVEKLYYDAFRRTDESAPRRDLRALMSFVATDPHSRLLGVFASGRQPPEDLVAIAWVRSHGDFVSYDIGASERAPDLGRTPLAYPLLWQSMMWSMANAHQWFDMGGVIAADAPADHPLAGITAFKARFTDERVRVGREFVLHPSAVLSGVSSALSAVAARVRAVRQ